MSKPPLTRQGVRNLDLIGPKPPRKVRCEFGHFWTKWDDISTESDDVAGYVHEVRDCTACGERETRAWNTFDGPPR